MLLDPFEEQLDLPSASIEFGDCEGRQRDVVGEKNQGCVGRGILEPNASQRRLEACVRIEAGEDDGLDRRSAPWHGRRRASTDVAL